MHTQKGGSPVFTEEDVDLLSLDASRFEEACFDLLMSLGYQELSWRQGSADSGRDIEGRWTVNNTLVSAYEERWFFECKRYVEGVPAAELNSKIAWADAEKPNHLVVMTTSHLTNDAAKWLEKIRPQKPYALHIVDGKALRRLFSSQDELMTRYFVSSQRKLLLDARRNWLIHGILPAPDMLRILATELDFSSLSPPELAFLWSSAQLRGEEIEALIEDSEPFYFGPLLKELGRVSNCAEPVIGPSEQVETLDYRMGGSSWEHEYAWQDCAELVVQRASKSRLALYSFVRGSDEEEGLEVLVEASSDFPVRIRHMKSGAHAAIDAARKTLWPREGPDPFE